MCHQPARPIVDGLEGAAIYLGISRIAPVERFGTEPAGTYYGEELPDLAFLQLNVRDLPSLEIEAGQNIIRAGVPVAYSGYPLGGGLVLHLEDRTAPIVVQAMPFVRQGIVSSVHPFPCPSPHGFTIDASSQGGASGSPIFLIDRPAVIGMLYAAVDGTNLTFALPGFLLKTALTQCLESGVLGEPPELTMAQHREFLEANRSTIPPGHDFRPI